MKQTSSTRSLRSTPIAPDHHSYDDHIETYEDVCSTRTGIRGASGPSIISHNPFAFSRVVGDDVGDAIIARRYVFSQTPDIPLKMTTPVWLFNKYKNLIVDRLFPLGAVEIDGFKFRYLRSDAPPHDPKALSSQRLEFHDRIDSLSGMAAIDIGANIGSYTLRLARRFQRITAYEPSPVHCKVLRLNLALNGLRNVHVEEIALSDINGVLPLYIRRGGATSLNRSHYGLKYDKIRSVNVAKLDDFQSRFVRLDFMKIDAEDQEYKILRGGREMISRFRPILAIEVHEARVPSDGSCSCNTCDALLRLEYSVEVTGELSGVRAVHWVWATPNEGPTFNGGESDAHSIEDAMHPG